MNQMSYQAKSNGNGTYDVLKNGVMVPGARVKRISFPLTTTHRLQGEEHIISGLCVATVNVPGLGDVEDVSVIF